jgi:glycosyltransferase involved in cell wall biosynthesis
MNKVCHISSVHPINDIRILNKECVSLAKAGFMVSLIAIDADIPKQEIINIVHISKPKKGRLFRMLFTSKLVYKKALDLNADTYHFHDPELIPYGIKLKRKGKKVIYDVHEDVAKQIMSKYYLPKSLRRLVSSIYERYEKGASKKFDAIITATPFIRNRFINFNKNTIDINNFPILNDESLPDWSERKNEICYIGGISKERGIFEMIKSMEQIDARLNLVGVYIPEKIREKLSQMPGWQKVNEYGLLNRKGVWGILSRSKIGIVTLHPILNYINALPVKMFEYMQAGIPVIASDFPLWKEIIANNNCGICVNPLNPDEIITAINKILNDNQTLIEMGKNGRKAIQEKYNWQKEEEKLLLLYNEL